MALHPDDRGDEYATVHDVLTNVNNVTSSVSSSYALQESGGASGLGGLGALSGFVNVKPDRVAVSGGKLELHAHVGAPRATPAQAAAADRDLVFPVCEAEPSACTDACMYRVELVMTRCMAWLQVSDARTGSGSLARSADKKAAACESALAAARGGCDAAEHADCLHPVAHNFEALLATHHRAVVA